MYKNDGGKHENKDESHTNIPAAYTGMSLRGVGCHRRRRGTCRKGH